jgi:hypothetical protein
VTSQNGESYGLVAGSIAAALAVAAMSMMFFDGAAALFVAFVSVTALAARLALRESPSSRLIDLAWPLLAVLHLVYEASTALVLLIAAAVHAGVIVTFALCRQREGRVDLFDGVALVLVVALPARFIGVSGVVEELLVCAGLVALVLALAVDRRLALEAIGVIAIVAVAAPSSNWRSATVPLVLAATFYAIRKESVPFAFAAAAFSLVAGRWSLALGLLPFLPIVFARRPRGELLTALVPFRFAPAAVQFLLVDPSLALRAFGVGRWRAIGAAGLAVLAVAVSRPQLALIYVCAGALLVVSSPDAPARRATPLLLVAAASLLLVPWSAAALPLLPYPIAIGGAVVLTIAVLAASSARGVVASLVAAAAVLGAVVVGFPPPAAERFEMNETLSSRGYTLSFGRPVREFEVFLSGANIAGLRGGTVVGSVDVVHSDGSGTRREISVGDFADWAAFSRGQIFGTHNPLPRSPEGEISGEGRNALRRGTGAVRFHDTRGAVAVRVLPAAGLPSGATLLLERVEVRER